MAVEPVRGQPSPMEKWLRVLEAFANRDEWGVRELARAVALPRSVVHRLLHEMARVGLLSPGSEPGRFSVGPALVRLASVVLDRLDVVRVARPILEETMRQCGETVILTLYDPTRRQFFAVDAVESPQAVRYIWDALRQWSHVHIGSSGKGILAFLPPQEQEAILADLPDPVPGLRPRSKDQLRQELVVARQRGYVVSRSERYTGAMGVAAPVYDALGRVVGDVIITAPESRMGARGEEEWGHLVMRAAGAISRALGHR